MATQTTNTEERRYSARVSVAVDPALKSLVNEICADEGIDISEVVRSALIAYVRKNEHDIEVIERKPGRPRKQAALAA